MAKWSRFNKIVLVGLGTIGGGLAYYQLDNGKTEQKLAVHNFWTKNYEPIVKWDSNWDHRELKSKKTKNNKSPEEDNSFNEIIEENSFNEIIEKAKKKTMRHLILIRHGQYNDSGTCYKNLTDLGRKQAEQTGKYLASLDIEWDLLIRSTMTRAQETATIIAEQFDKDIPVQDCDLITEGPPIPPEPLSGKLHPESAYFQQGGRIEAGFRKYFHRAPAEQKKSTYTLIVGHSNVIRYFVCKALQFPPEAWLRLSLNHGSITWISIYPNGDVKLSPLSHKPHVQFYSKIRIERLLYSLGRIEKKDR